MSTVGTEYSVVELLERAGAKLVGRNRADCPQCQGKRTVAYRGEVFFCHHARCDFKGNVRTLARSLGLLQPMTPEQAREFRAVREESRQAAACVLGRIRERRFQLCEAYRSLLCIRDGTTRRLKLKPEDDLAWKGLQYFYRECPAVAAELAFLQHGPVADRVAFLEATEVERREKLARILRAGGFTDQEGKWVEVLE
jgi:hypothetical protein